MKASSVFIRHLFTSIRRRPLQPFLLVFVLTFSVAMCVMVVDIGIYLPENIQNGAKAQSGSAEYALSVGVQSETRFMLYSDVEEVLPEGTESCGVFGMPLFYGDKKEFVYGVATDLNDVQKIFELRFKERLQVPSNRKAECIFITEQFADEHGIEIGDEITFSASETKKTFLVCGISTNPFLGQYTVMFDISAEQSLLENNSVFFSCFSDEFVLVNEVYIKTNGKAEETVTILHETFPDKEVEVLKAKTMSMLFLVEKIEFIMLLITVFFSVIVVYSCFNILSMQRKEETELFFGVGAVKNKLYLASAVEMLVYWTVGSVFGILLSIPLSKGILSAAYMGYCEYAMHPKSVLIALGTSLLSSEGGLAVYILSDLFKKPKKKREKSGARKEYVGIVMLAVGVLLTAVSAFLEAGTGKLLIVCLAGVGIMLGVFFLGKGIVSFHARRKGKSEKIKPYVRYALKNMKRTVAIGNSAGLISIIIIVFFAQFLMIDFGDEAVTAVEGVLHGDYYIANGSPDMVEELMKTEGVKKATPVYFGTSEILNETRIFVSVPDQDILACGYKFDRLPQGDEIFISKSLAEQYGLQYGDKVTFKIGTKEYEAYYTQNFESFVINMVFDSEYYGLSSTGIVGELSDGYDLETVSENIMSTLGYNNIAVTTLAEIAKSTTQQVKNYMLCMRILVVFVMVFSTVAIVDNLVESYRSRREEFLCYAAAGMSRKELRKMKGAEIGLSVGLSMGVFCITALPMFFMLYEAMQSLWIDMFLVWEAAWHAVHF